MRLSLGSVLFGALVVAVVAAVGTGLYVLGSPKDSRARRVDDRRVADLQAIVAATDLYWTRHSRLPASLDALTAEPGVRLSTGDPASADVYGYQALDSTRYELCASFEAESGETSRRPVRNLWAHGAGRHCFQLGAEAIERKDEGGRPRRP